jgi:hypothetical protein
MRKTNYKVDSIKDYIINNAPTRSELVKFIVVELNGTSEAYFDKYPRSFRGYYATNISNMRKSGNIWSKNGKYYVTKQGLTNENSLYHKPDKARLREERKYHEWNMKWSNNRYRDAKAEARDLRQEVQILKATLDNINMLSKID